MTPSQEQLIQQIRYSLQPGAILPFKNSPEELVPVLVNYSHTLLEEVDRLTARLAEVEKALRKIAETDCSDYVDPGDLQRIAERALEEGKSDG